MFTGNLYLNNDTTVIEIIIRRIKIKSQGLNRRRLELTVRLYKTRRKKRKEALLSCRKNIDKKKIHRIILY